MVTLPCGTVKVMVTLPSLGDLFVLVLIHDELGGLPRWVNDERVAVEPLDHDGILCAQVV